MRRFRRPLSDFAAPAKRGASLWRTGLGVALVCALTLLFLGAARDGTAQLLLRAGLFLGAEREMRESLGMIMTLGAFLAVWPALWLVLPMVHLRPARTLFGPSGRIDWRHFRLGLAVALAAGAVAWGPLMVLHGDDLITRADLRGWLVLALVVTPLIFIQCAAEELFFRGYLVQQLAARSLSALGWSIIPALVFGLAHPAEGAWLSVSWYHFVFGLVMAAVTWRTANLGAAIGLHFGINLVNILLVAPADLLAGLALIVAPQEVDTLAPRLAYVAMMFLGAATFMGYMDLRFLRAWRGSAVEEARHARARIRRLNEPAGGSARAGP